MNVSDMFNRTEQYFHKLDSYSKIVTSTTAKDTYETLMGFDENSAVSEEDIKSGHIENIAKKNIYCDVFEKDGSLGSDNWEDTEYSLYKLTSDFNDRLNIGLGLSQITDKNVAKERIAGFFGDMGKRLDEAHAKGKFTDEEYEGLNQMIEEQMEHFTSNVERKFALQAIGRERGSLSPMQALELSRKEQTMTNEEKLTEREAKINEYVEKYFKIDRQQLIEMFTAIRKDLSVKSYKT